MEKDNDYRKLKICEMADLTGPSLNTLFDTLADWNDQLSDIDPSVFDDLEPRP